MLVKNTPTSIRPDKNVMSDKDIFSTSSPVIFIVRTQ